MSPLSRSRSVAFTRRLCINSLEPAKLLPLITLVHIFALPIWSQGCFAALCGPPEPEPASDTGRRLIKNSKNKCKTFAFKFTADLGQFIRQFGYRGSALVLPKAADVWLNLYLERFTG